MKLELDFAPSSADEMGKWNGICSRPDCSRTNPPVAYGKARGECFTHEMLGVFFQYEMAGHDDGWKEPDEIEERREAWLKKLANQGIDLDAFAEAFTKS